MSLLSWFRKSDDEQDDPDLAGPIPFQNTADPTRIVAFRLFHQNMELLAGTFAVTTRPGASGFGVQQMIPRPDCPDCEVCLLNGMVLQHQMDNEGGISMSLEYYELEPCEVSPLGYRQHQILKAGIAMGCDTGEIEEDSVMIGEEHTFYYKTKKL